MSRHDPSTGGFTLTQLFERGWTPILVRALLGAPDSDPAARRDGPAVTTDWYARARVRQLEHDPLFHALRARPGSTDPAVLKAPPRGRADLDRYSVTRAEGPARLHGIVHAHPHYPRPTEFTTGPLVALDLDRRLAHTTVMTYQLRAPLTQGEWQHLNQLARDLASGVAPDSELVV